MKQYRGITHLFLLLFFVIAGIIAFPEQKALAADTPVKVASVDYYNENVILTSGSNTKFYFAIDTDAVKGNWDVIPVDSGSTTTIDLSWMPVSSDNILTIKGDVDQQAVRITLKKKPAKLALAINYSNMDGLPKTASIATLVNIMSSEGNGSNPLNFSDLEWRKGDNGQWASADTLTVALLDKYLIKGAYIYFRIRAVNDVASGTDYPDGRDGRRFSDPIKIKIVKTLPPMVYGIDGSDFSASVKYGKEYRVTVTYSDASTGSSSWAKVNDKAVKAVPLATMANNVTPRKNDADGKPIVFNGETVAFPKMHIEVRDYATERTASSKITEIDLDAQRTLTKAIKIGQPDLNAPQDKDDIYVYYSGNKYILLTIPCATVDLPYEYCVVKPGDEFDINRVSWSSVTKGSGVKILNNKAVDGGKLYVRQKEIKSKAATKTAAAVSYKLASTYVSQAISYPCVPIVTKDTLTYVKNYTSTPVSITIQLNTSGKPAFETSVKSVKLGVKDIGFTQSTAPSSTDPSISILTVTLKNEELAAISNCTNKALTINFAGGTVDKTSIKLTIKNPTVSGTLNLMAEKGSAAGKTKITVASVPGFGNTWVYVVGGSEITGKYVEDILPDGTGTVFHSGDEIAVAPDQYITIYELNSSRNIIKLKSIKITS